MDKKRKILIGIILFCLLAMSINPKADVVPVTSTFTVQGEGVLLSNEDPSNHSTDVLVSTTIWNVTMNISSGTFNWSIEAVNASTGFPIGSNSSNGASNGSKLVNISGNLSYGINYTVWVNATGDDVALTNATYWFVTTSIMTITRISQTPTNIRTNTTGSVEILFNITTTDTAINNTSIFVVHTVNHSCPGHYCTNFSYRIPADNNQPNKLRACSRNEGYWFEQFNNSGTGEIGSIGAWGVHNETLCNQFEINATGSNWTRIKWTPQAWHLFSTIWYVDKSNMVNQSKAGQTLDIYGNEKYMVRTYYNMTDTCFYDCPKYNYSLYQLFFYDWHDNAPSQPLKVYFANESYTTGKPSTSQYCTLIGEISSGDAYNYTTQNSSYHILVFSTNETGYVGSVNMSSNFSIVFASTAPNVAQKYYVYYADDNVSEGGRYHNFNQSDTTQTTSDSGNTWTFRNGTVDCHLQFVKLDDTDNIQYKMYAQDVNDNNTWSSVYSNLIDITNYPPNPPDVLIPNSSVETYITGSNINITYGWLGDPNLETCWVNITCHNSTHHVVAWPDNRSITPAEYSVNNTWWYLWDTTGLAIGGPYHINITATDPQNVNTSSEQNSTFNITTEPVFVVYATNTFGGKAEVQGENPVISNVDPANGSIDEDMYPLLNITITDPQNDDMNITWSTNATGDWKYWNVSCGSGTYHTQRATFANASNTKYWWTVQVNDTNGNWANETYNFTTATYSWGNWSDWWTFNYTHQSNLSITNFSLSDTNKHTTTITASPIDWINFTVDVEDTAIVSVFLNITDAFSVVHSENITANNTGYHYWCNRTILPSWGNGTYSVHIYTTNATEYNTSSSLSFTMYPTCDVNMNNVTSATDITQVTGGGNWGSNGVNRFCVEDVNENGWVTASDITSIVNPNNWGNVPSP